MAAFFVGFLIAFGVAAINPEMGLWRNLLASGCFVVAIYLAVEVAG